MEFQVKIEDTDDSTSQKLSFPSHELKMEDNKDSITPYPSSTKQEQFFPAYGNYICKLLLYKTCTLLFLLDTRTELAIVMEHQTDTKVQLQEESYRCNICSYKCTKKSSLQTHIYTHSREANFKCKICGYKCTYKSNLERHMRVHSGEKPFRCKKCNHKCADRSNLLKHIVRVHNGENPFECTICGYKCSQKGHLGTHMRVYSGERPLGCNINVIINVQRKEV